MIRLFSLPPVSRQSPRIQPGQRKTGTDESGDSYHCGTKDDEQHDVVAADVGGAGQEDGHDEDEGGGEHGGCVGEAGEEVNHTLTKGESMLVLNLMTWIMLMLVPHDLFQRILMTSKIMRRCRP